MPTLSIYVSHEIYEYLSKKGTPSKVGKDWIEGRFKVETKEKGVVVSAEPK